MRSQIKLRMPIYTHHNPGFVSAQIGATAHYVTADLDEGPIIEQDVERVNHAYTPAELTKVGADVEARVLARAVRWHSERRVLMNGAKVGAGLRNCG